MFNFIMLQDFPRFPLDSLALNSDYIRGFFSPSPRIEPHRFDKQNIVLGCKTNTHITVMNTVSLKKGHWSKSAAHCKKYQIPFKHVNKDHFLVGKNIAVL